MTHPVNSIVCFNGEFIDQNSPVFRCVDRAVCYGDGVFTTIRAVNGVIDSFDLHYQRLVTAATVFDLNWCCPSEALKRNCAFILANNQLSEGLAALRVMLLRGGDAEGLSLPEATAASHWVIRGSRYRQPQGTVRLITAPMIQSSQAWTVRFKTLNYLDAIMARRYARSQGYDDAIFCNEQGNMVSTTSANLFFLENGIIKTPATTAGALAGVMRARVLAYAHQAGIPVIEGHWPVAALHEAEAIWLTNSMMGVQCVTGVAEQVYPAGHPLLQVIQALCAKRL